jgi:hypothetical protein
MDSCGNSGGVPFGEKDGIQYDVTEVPQGLRCGCHCPYCKAPLIARKGNILRHHFAHTSGADCAGGLETSVHQAAKQIVQQSKSLMLPGAGDLDGLKTRADWLRHANRPAASATWLFPPDLRAFGTVEAEKLHLHPASGKWVKPDLTCDDDLLIEFFVSHQVEADKQAVLAELGIPCIEVDLRPFIRDWLDGIRSSEATPAMKQLEEFLLSSDSDRTWLHDPRVAQWLETNRMPEFPSTTGSQLDLFPGTSANSTYRH